MWDPALTIGARYCSFSFKVIVAFVNLTFNTCLYKSKGDLDLKRSRCEVVMKAENEINVQEPFHICHPHEQIRPLRCLMLTCSRTRYRH